MDFTGTYQKEKTRNPQQGSGLKILLDLTGIQVGGGAGIRTLGGVTPTTVFETVPFSRSGTSPRPRILTVFLNGRQCFHGNIVVLVVRPGKVAYSSGCEARPGRSSQPLGSESLDRTG